MDRKGDVIDMPLDYVPVSKEMYKKYVKYQERYNYIVGFLKAFEDSHDKFGKSYPEKTIDLVKTLRKKNILPKKES